MKKILLMLAAALIIIACSNMNGVGQSNSKYAKELNEKELAAAIKKSINADGGDVSVSVKEIKRLDRPAGFSYVEVTISAKDGSQLNKEFFFTDGSYITKDFGMLNGVPSLAQEIDFDMEKIKSIDVSALSLVMGEEGAKNVIVEITDFQCPYCKKASQWFADKLKNRKDTALYIVHMPLRMHPNAETMAKIFEAGKLMGKNFSEDLFNSDYISVINDKIAEAKTKNKNLDEKQLNEMMQTFVDTINKEIVEEYAAKSGNPVKFKEFFNSDEVNAKLEASKSLADFLGVRSTPTVYINGKEISGFNESIYEKAIQAFN